MKNLKRYALCFLLVLIIPIALLLSGCGATSTNEARGVFFDGNLYDEEDVIFEVDLNTETELTYKVNPSSWSGYKAVYQTLKSGENEENRTRFELKDGKITVTDPNFEEITVQITLNGYKDVCKIRLKEYPTEIFLLNENGERVSEVNKTICADGYDNIHVYGLFAGNSEPVELKDDRFNFKLTSSDSTVIEIPNDNRLTVYTLKTKPEASEVQINLLDSSGNSKFGTLKIKYNVVPKVAGSYISLDGYGHFITDETEEIEVNLNKLDFDKEKQQYLVGFEIILIDLDGFVSVGEVKDITASSDAIKFDKDSGKILIRTTDLISFDLTFYFNLVSSDGTPYLVNFRVNTVNR